MFKPRPKQQAVLDYTRGKMGVAAVPGSGKTRTLSALAAKLVSGPYLGDDQEVLVVTLVNSATDHFARQVGMFVRESGLLPGVGYRVRTLHSLCNDIVRERPGLVGLSDSFQIVDEREADGILQDAVQTWLRTNPNSAEAYLPPDMETNRRDWLYREQWPDLVLNITRNFVRQAKDEQLLPDAIRYKLDRFGKPLPLAEMGWHVYANYQRGLSFRGAVDFQDLIRLALQALQLDEAYLKRLRHRWPYILEDEAQDSSQLQEAILRLLAGENGNWIRVGDPNQAIYETFTTARPEHLWNFLKEPDVQARELPNSGRSAQPIIDLANFLIDWTRRTHPVVAVRERAPLQPPHIQPAPQGDPQPNPPADEAKVTLFSRALTPAEEVQAVVQSLAQWLPEHPDETAAVLVPRNKRGFEVVDALKRLREPKLEFVEILRSTTTTREAAGALGNILNYLAQPGSPPLLATVYKVWRRADRDDETTAARLEEVVKALRKCQRVEEFIWPQLGLDWLDSDPALAEVVETYPEVREHLTEFRDHVRRWQEAVLLPVDQLILILAQDLFRSSADLAIAHSIAVLLRQYGELHPDYRLPQFTEELAVIAKNERRFLGLDNDDRGFDPQRHKGKVTIATMHSAKGLEWDRVYLMSVNNYDFPSALPGDRYLSERWFLRDELNLEAEALAQLHALTDELAFGYDEGDATRQSRLDYVAERLRLLYVGITRARKELIITWNTGQRGDQVPAAPFVAMQSFHEETTNESAP